ncbi:hypothetical protein SEVIR_8G006725v4 [Setaria viridis]
MGCRRKIPHRITASKLINYMVHR